MDWDVWRVVFIHGTLNGCNSACTMFEKHALLASSQFHTRSCFFCRLQNTHSCELCLHAYMNGRWICIGALGLDILFYPHLFILLFVTYSIDPTKQNERMGKSVHSKLHTVRLLCGHSCTSESVLLIFCWFLVNISLPLPLSFFLRSLCGVCVCASL